MKTYVLLLIFLLCPVLFGQIAIFEDDFNRSEIGSNWAVSHGNWSIVENKLQFIGDGTYSSNFIYYVNELSLDEFTIDCKVMWVANGYFEDGVVCFYKNMNFPYQGYEHDDYFHCYLSAFQGDNPRIGRYNITNTQPTTFAAMNQIDSLLLTPNVWYNFRVTAQKNFVSSWNPPDRNVDIHFYLDGQLVLRYWGYADSLKGNFVGLGSGNGAFSQIAYYDDFKVYPGIVPVDVSSNEISMAKDFSMAQNYPNPFNPSTTIEYELKKPETVKINIYDINGRLVRELINEEKNTGHYSINWDGKDNSGKIIASSTYFYQIQAGSYGQAKKMIFLK